MKRLNYFIKDKFSVCSVLFACTLQTALHTTDTLLIYVHKIQPAVWVCACHFTLVQEQSPKMLV